MTEVIRPREKTQEQLRGFGVNSIRLAPEGRSNETAQTVAGGVSTDPKSIKINLRFLIFSKNNIGYQGLNIIDNLLRDYNLTKLKLSLQFINLQQERQQE